MRDLTAAQIKALDRIAEAGTNRARVVGWCDHNNGPILRAGSLDAALCPDGTFAAPARNV